MIRISPRLEISRWIHHRKDMLYLYRILLLMHDVFNALTLRISLIYLLVSERYINIRHDPLQLEVTSLNIQGLISWLTFFYTRVKLWNSIHHEMRKIPEKRFNSSIAKQLLQILRDADDYVGVLEISKFNQK